MLDWLTGGPGELKNAKQDRTEQAPNIEPT